MKKCTKCLIPKGDDCFSKGQYWCKDCCKQYRIENKDKQKFAKQVYLEENKDIIKEKKHSYYMDNRDYFIDKRLKYNLENQNDIRKYQKEYRIKNKEYFAEYQKEYQYSYRKKRKLIDPTFKLRLSLSTAINFALKKASTSKNGKSIGKYLTYTMQELKEHLESQFEPWMTWDNHGTYDPKIWNDNDQSTWTWQIDHIIPCSKFHYFSMEDNKFLECWALSNLRPYSAKQNIIDKDKR